MHAPPLSLSLCTPTKNNATQVADAMGGLVTKGLIRGWGMCNDNCYGLTAWSKCHLGGAIPGHHGLLRLQLKAWDCPPHSAEATCHLRSHREAVVLEPKAAQVAIFSAFDHTGLTASSWAARAQGVAPPCVMQNDYSILNRRIVRRGSANPSLAMSDPSRLQRTRPCWPSVCSARASLCVPGQEENGLSEASSPLHENAGFMAVRTPPASALASWREDAAPRPRWTLAPCDS